MKLFCEKYNETALVAEAGCRRPNEYCKFRSACIIHFLGQKRDRTDAAQGHPTPQARDREDPGSETSEQ